MDGLGRRDRIRYDTPKFAGFGITSSHGNSDARDVALRYGSELGSVKIKAAVAWSDAHLTETVNGSLSILLPVGLSFTIAGVVQLVEPLGIELQAGYARFSLEQPGLADPDDIDVITLGARVKF